MPRAATRRRLLDPPVHLVDPHLDEGRADERGDLVLRDEPAELVARDPDEGDVRDPDLAVEPLARLGDREDRAESRDERPGERGVRAEGPVERAHALVRHLGAGDRVRHRCASTRGADVGRRRGPVVV